MGDHPQAVGEDKRYGHLVWRSAQSRGVPMRSLRLSILGDAAANCANRKTHRRVCGSRHRRSRCETPVDARLAHAPWNEPRRDPFVRTAIARACSLAIRISWGRRRVARSLLFLRYRDQWCAAVASTIASARRSSRTSALWTAGLAVLGAAGRRNANPASARVRS